MQNNGKIESVERPVILSVRDVGKTYRIYSKPQDRLKQGLWCGRRQYYREFQALRGVSFDLHRGEFLGVVGRNGSGKSTLLQLVTGTLQPSTGEVHRQGRIAALLELGSGFNPEFTGRENIYLNGSILGLGHDQIEAHFDEIAAFADIGQFLEQPVKTYSTGMVVRLAFAVQIILEPDLLIVDEALAVGDAAFQHRCYRRLDELKERGVSLLFVSHGLELVRTICDRAIYLDHGSVKAQGASATVCDAYFQDLLDEQVRQSPANPATDPDAVAAGGMDDDARPAETRQVLDRYLAGQPTEATIQGSLDLEIVRAELLGNRPEGGPLIEQDWLRVVAHLRVNRPVHRFMFGIMIRDRVGSEMFGFSAHDHELGLPETLHPGESLRLEATVKVDLRADTYFVTLGLQTPGFSDVLFYGHDMLSFKVEAPARRDPLTIGGVARLEHTVEAALSRVESLENAV